MPYKNLKDRKAHDRIYYLANKEKKYQQHKDWVAKHKEESRDYQKKWYEEHPGYNTQKSIKYYHAHNSDPEFKKAHSERVQKYRHRKGITKPMSENKECPLYLGVHIAERALSTFFEHIERMPKGNKGYDFLCGHGKKIDVKSSCIYRVQIRGKNYEKWEFVVRKNKIADYFLCLAFNNRKDLIPMHVWLVPGQHVNSQTAFTISNSSLSLARWLIFEKPMGKLERNCQSMREGDGSN